MRGKGWGEPSTISSPDLTLATAVPVTSQELGPGSAERETALPLPVSHSLILLGHKSLPLTYALTLGACDRGWGGLVQLHVFKVQHVQSHSPHSSLTLVIICIHRPNEALAVELRAQEAIFQVIKKSFNFIDVAIK